MKDEIYPEVQLQKWDLYQNETAVNFPVTTIEGVMEKI